MSQFHFDPATYAELMRTEVPLYETLQETVAGETEGVAATSLLDLGSGTGETLARVLARVLARNPTLHAVGVDENVGMLEVARQRLAGLDVEFRVADLLDPLPAGPFDLVTSALAIHHLDGAGKATLFGRVAEVLRPGGRFVLGDVVVPDDAAAAVNPLCDDYDKPSTVAEQVGWLSALGLVPRVVWQGDDLAVLTADRPA
ncbi:MAG TPA: class I SAM-dependent methyltransferase [Acidimicrobiales bacterium]